MSDLARQDWSETRNDERAYPLRYVSEERRSRSPKSPGPEGEARSWPTSSLLVAHIAQAMLAPRVSNSAQACASKSLILFLDNALRNLAGLWPQVKFRRMKYASLFG